MSVSRCSINGCEVSGMDNAVEMVPMHWRPTPSITIIHTHSFNDSTVSAVISISKAVLHGNCLTRWIKGESICGYCETDFIRDLIRSAGIEELDS